MLSYKPKQFHIPHNLFEELSYESWTQATNIQTQDLEKNVNHVNWSDLPLVLKDA